MSDLSKLNKAKLLALCEKAGLTAEAEATKAELIALLEAVKPKELVEAVAETPKKESKKTTSGSEIDMELDGLAFVKACYLTLLKREGDEGGLAHYHQRLSMEGDKEAVIESLKASQEYLKLQ